MGRTVRAVAIVAAIVLVATLPSAADQRPAAHWKQRQTVAPKAIRAEPSIEPDHGVVIDRRGVATAAWVNPWGILRMAHRRPGHRWGPSITVGKGSSFGGLVVDRRGRVTVLWDDYNRATEVSRVFVRSWRPGRGFGPRKELGRGSVSGGDLATNARGDLLAAWGGDGFMWTSYRRAGRHWRPKSKLAGNAQNYWRLALTGDGRGYALGGGDVLRLQSYAPRTNRWRRLRRLSTGGGYALWPDIAANANGDVIAGWTYAVTDGEEYFYTGTSAVYKRAGHKFGRTRKLLRPRRDDLRYGATVEVGIDRSGIGHVAWVGDKPRHDWTGQLRVAHRKPGGGWSESRSVARNVTDGSFDLAVTPGGAVLATGIHFFRVGGEAFAVRRPPSGPFGKPRLLTTYQVFPSRAVSDFSHGRGVVLFHRSNRHLYARSFER